MDDPKPMQAHSENPHGGGARHHHLPYWKRAHQDWRFWVGVCAMLLAMFIYVMSNEMVWRPRRVEPIKSRQL